VTWGTTCARRVNRNTWGYQPCGRPLETDEQREAERCGPHLAGEKRSAANEIARQERSAAAQVKVKEMRGIADRFRALLPDGEPNGISVYDDEIRMRRPVAEHLLGLLEVDDD
jgi:hypothetical protein